MPETKLGLATETPSRLQAILNLSRDAILSISLEGTITAWNATAIQAQALACVTACHCPSSISSDTPSSMGAANSDIQPLMVDGSRSAIRFIWMLAAAQTTAATMMRPIAQSAELSRGSPARMPTPPIAIAMPSARRQPIRSLKKIMARRAEATDLQPQPSPTVTISLFVPITSL